MSDVAKKEMGDSYVMVNHPAHYGGDTQYETIKVLANWLTEEQLVGFCLGNAIKYLSRLQKKGDTPGHTLQDARKAQWYLNYLISLLERKVTSDESNDG